MSFSSVASRSCGERRDGIQILIGLSETRMPKRRALLPVPLDFDALAKFDLSNFSGEVIGANIPLHLT
jgi:hypothetical protein